MTKFTGPLQVGPWQSASNNAVIDVSGSATFTGATITALTASTADIAGLSGLDLVNTEVTAAAQTSGPQYISITVNGSNYRLAIYDPT